MLQGLINKNAAVSAAPAVAYVGPGDVVASAVGWWGLRAYSSASIGANAIRLVRASDSTQQTFVTVAGGGLDMTSITAFLASTTGKVVTIFDQSGGGVDLTQGTDANRPAFTLSGIGSLPCMTFAGAQNLQLTGGTYAQPNTASGVYKRASGGESTAFGTGSPTLLGFAAGANTLEMYAGGGVPTAAASDGSFHAIQATFNGASSELYVDGSASGGSTASGSFSGTYFFGTDSFAQALTGAICEIGIWNSALSAGNKSGLNSNQHTYWGF